jgi:hypothetical protein
MNLRSILRAIHQWMDLLILLPITLLLFVTGNDWIRHLDPTASVVELGTLSILIFNLVCLFSISSAAYFLYSLWFNDLFTGDWWAKLTRWQAVKAHLILWTTVLLLSAYVLLRNL